MTGLRALFATGLMLLACAQSAGAQDSFTIKGGNGHTLTAEVIAEFNRPWAMTFLPDGRMLVSTKPGKLFLVSQSGESVQIGQDWPTVHRGQGGLGDVVLHPDFANNSLVYVSYVEAGKGGTSGTVVVRGKLNLDGKPSLTSITRIWEQTPKMRGNGHFSQKLAFGRDGKLYITAGDRQKLTPAQDFSAAMGKIIRLNDDGSVPQDNPWQDKGALAKSFWSTGHRNPLGIAFDGSGRLWAHEMGPAHGDELNLIKPGQNYGWPLVSNGNHYSGRPIPDHDTRPEFAAPKAFWVPAISPAGLTIYSGTVFESWQGDALIGGLSSRALVHVDLAGDTAREVTRYEWDERVRETEQGPEGALWVLEDGSRGRLLKLTPAK